MSPEEILKFLDTMIDFQRGKVLKIARELVPGVTQEDIRNSFDFPELAASQRFNFEDGILSGYIGAKTALQTEFKQNEEVK